MHPPHINTCHRHLLCADPGAVLGLGPAPARGPRAHHRGHAAQRLLFLPGQRAEQWGGQGARCCRCCRCCCCCCCRCCCCCCALYEGNQVPAGVHVRPPLHGRLRAVLHRRGKRTAHRSSHMLSLHHHHCPNPRSSAQAHAVAHMHGTHQPLPPQPRRSEGAGCWARPPPAGARAAVRSACTAASWGS